METSLLRFIKSLILALSVTFSSFGLKAEAVKLVAPPLPHEKELKDFSQGQETIIEPSRFQRRPDYRELEAQKKKAQEDEANRSASAKQKASEEAQKAQLEALENYKKRQQLAVESNNKGVASGKQGKWLEAIEAHEAAVKLDPENKQFRINLSAARTAYGQSRLAKSDLDGAASLFRKALAAAADNGLAGRLLSEVMQRQGRDPASCEVRLATGDQLAAIGDLEGASVEYQQALQLESSARTYVKMADMALRFGQLTAASSWLRQAIIKDPEYGPAHRQLGLLELSQKDFTGAAASLRKALILDPKDTAAGQTLIEIWRRQVAANPLLAENHLGLAGALQLTGDFAGADNEYRKLETLDPKNPALESGRQSLARAIQHAKAEKHKLAAETLFNQGLRQEALAEISQAVMLEPHSARFQFLLGECLEASGDYQGAHRAYLTCVLIDPEKNKEAAARMKQMQSCAKGQLNPSITGGQLVNQIVSQLNGQTQQTPNEVCQSENKRQSFETPEASNLPHKDMFEGAADTAMDSASAHFHADSESNLPNNDNHNVNSDNHNLPTNTSTLQSNQTTISVNSPKAGEFETSSNLNDALSRVTDAEAQKDYVGAISALRLVLTKNLQNAEIHHRLAIDLLTTGQITEAISEFRIASALCPSKHAYADDLARALQIHKRALSTNVDGQDVAITTKEKGSSQ